MSLYESTFIARHEMSTQQVEGLAETFSAIITENGGEVKKTEHWGLRNLAYRIKKNRKGHYVFFNIDAPPAALQEFERHLRLNEDVLRYLTVKVEELDPNPSAIVQSRAPRDDRARRGGPYGGRDRGDAAKPAVAEKPAITESAKTDKPAADTTATAKTVDAEPTKKAATKSAPKEAAETTEPKETAEPEKEVKAADAAVEPKTAKKTKAKATDTDTDTDKGETAKSEPAKKAKTATKEKAPAKEKAAAKEKAPAKTKAAAKEKAPAKTKAAAKEEAPVKAKAATKAKPKATAKAKSKSGDSE